MNTSTVTSKGQLVIPAKLRKKHNIKKGTKIAFIENGNKLSLQPVNKNYFRELIGITGTKGKALKSLMNDKKKEREL